MVEMSRALWITKAQTEVFPTVAQWELPPKAKIYEALSAVADGRVRIAGPGDARVTSSSGDKTYSVTWSEESNTIGSNDNASFWQGYLGYPIIAVLMTLRRVRCHADIARQLAGVPWKRLNTKFKRDYDRAIEHVLAEIEAKGGDSAAIRAEVDDVFEDLINLHLERPKRTMGPAPRG